MIKETMHKLDGVRKDLDGTRAQVAQLRKEMETMKKSSHNPPNLVANPRIEAL
jgi:hypothetical protein